MLRLLCLSLGATGVGGGDGRRQMFHYQPALAAVLNSLTLTDPQYPRLRRGSRSAVQTVTGRRLNVLTQQTRANSISHMEGMLGSAGGCNGLQRSAGTRPVSGLFPFRVQLRQSKRPALRRSWPMATLSIPRPGAAVVRFVFV